VIETEYPDPSDVTHLPALAMGVGKWVTGCQAAAGIAQELKPPFGLGCLSFQSWIA